MPESEIQEKKFKPRRWHHRRDLRFITIVGMVLISFYGFGVLTGPAKISTKLMTEMESGDDRLNIEVKSRFAPEAFHMSIYQAVGSIRGSEGQVAKLYRVAPEDITMLSRKYWVLNITAAPPQKR
jgi:hypothetical protein